jgi:hypothetical protein
LDFNPSPSHYHQQQRYVEAVDESVLNSFLGTDDYPEEEDTERYKGLMKLSSEGKDLLVKPTFDEAKALLDSLNFFYNEKNHEIKAQEKVIKDMETNLKQYKLRLEKAKNEVNHIKSLVTKLLQKSKNE